MAAAPPFRFPSPDRASLDALVAGYERTTGDGVVRTAQRNLIAACYRVVGDTFLELVAARYAATGTVTNLLGEIRCGMALESAAPDAPAEGLSEPATRVDSPRIAQSPAGPAAPIDITTRHGQGRRSDPLVDGFFSDEELERPPLARHSERSAGDHVGSVRRLRGATQPRSRADRRTCSTRCRVAANRHARAAIAAAVAPHVPGPARAAHGLHRCYIGERGPAMSQPPGPPLHRLARRRSSADARDDRACGRIEEPFLGLISLWLADVAAEATAEADPPDLGMTLAFSAPSSVHGRVAPHLIYVRRSYKEATAADVSDEMQEAACRALLPAGAAVRVISDSGGHQSGYSAARDGYQALLARGGGGRGGRDRRVRPVAAGPQRPADARPAARARAPARCRSWWPTCPGPSSTVPPGATCSGSSAWPPSSSATSTAERMTGMQRQLFEEGRHRGHDPFGYRSRRDAAGNLVHPRQLEIVPEEAAVVRRIWPTSPTTRSTRSPTSSTAMACPIGAVALDPRRGEGHLAPRPRVPAASWWRSAGRDERPGRHEPILTEAEYRRTVAAVAAARWCRQQAATLPRLPAAGPPRLRLRDPDARARRTSSGAANAATTAARPSAATPRGAAADTVEGRGARRRSPRACCRTRSSRRRAGSCADGSRRRAPSAPAASGPASRSAWSSCRSSTHWGDLDDAAYLKARDETKAALAELPDGDRIRRLRRLPRARARPAGAIARGLTGAARGALPHRDRAGRGGRPARRRDHLDAAGPAVLREKTAGVPPRGFEPLISTLKGWRPRPLDDGGAVGRVYAASVPAARSGLSSWSSRSAPGRRRHRAKRPPRWRTDRRTAPRRTPSGRPAHRPRG